ncbi:hypothetical protein BN1058_02610 [Paraliobacillus sp. PM-2]|uniref:hypothetical protein n=1 Tax=Paraliobacillus sp. PM-2 TaxID=1462524 RepID=UPI00061C249F|nr:hypothetical protein [Paraliobacillus sp. PM-2]CQR48256.1 hypothetical protein BN1058_02610 [Paraliobacillus sp. PM-2]
MFKKILFIGGIVGLLVACQSDGNFAIEDPYYQELFEKVDKKVPIIVWNNQEEVGYSEEQELKIKELSNKILKTMEVVESEKAIEEINVKQKNKFISVTYMGYFKFFIFPSEKNPNKKIYLESPDGYEVMETKKGPVKDLISWMENKDSNRVGG